MWITQGTCCYLHSSDRTVLLEIYGSSFHPPLKNRFKVILEDKSIVTIFPEGINFYVKWKPIYFVGMS